jgi:TonB family protein
VVHAVSATFRKFERMSPPAAVMALLLHAAVAALLIWAPLHPRDDLDEAIDVTMEAPPPPPETKPEPPKPEPKPQAEQPKPPPPQPKPQPQQPTPALGLPPAGPIGEKNTAPPMERGLPTHELPPEKAEKPTPKDDAPPPQVLEQQAVARPADPPPPPPPTLEKELPPVETPPPPVTSEDIPRITPPLPERKPEPQRAPPQPQQQQAQPPRPPAGPQLQPSPLSRLPRNAPSQQRQTEPRTTFVNPADSFAQNTLMTAYLQRVAYQVSRYRFDGGGLSPSDSVVAQFTIARNGGLLSISIVRSSGKSKLDRDAVTAFQSVAPFPPLPGEIPGDARTFTLTFWPGRTN